MFLDVSSIHLCASRWWFALPKGVDRKAVHATVPKVKEPAGRHFIHCLQHWVVRYPKNVKNRLRKYAPKELDQETILVDNHGQIYTIYANCGLPNDMGVRYFTIEPDDTYVPLTLDQIYTIKQIQLCWKSGEEGLPSMECMEAKWRTEIAAAIASPIPAPPFFTHSLIEKVGKRPKNPTVEEPDLPVEPVHAHIAWYLQEAYVHMQYGTEEEKEDGRRLLSSYIKRIFPESLHIRVDVMNRTQLSRRITKYYGVEFPPAATMVLAPYKQEYDWRIIRVESIPLLPLSQ